MRVVPTVPPPVLLLDAGNVLVCLDGVAVSRALAGHGVAVDAAAIEAAEAVAKRAYETSLRGDTSHEHAWEQLLEGILVHAGVAADRAGALVPVLRAEHDEFNLWRRVPEGVRGALEALRGAGVRLGVVSNSEGRLVRLLGRLDLAPFFDEIVDSGVEGVRKPDPAIFHLALSRLGVAAHDAMYAGDIPGVDVDGARAAGVRAVLIDAGNLYPRYTGALRYQSLAHMTRTIYRLPTTWT